MYTWFLIHLVSSTISCTASETVTQFELMFYIISSIYINQTFMKQFLFIKQSVDSGNKTVSKTCYIYCSYIT